MDRMYAPTVLWNGVEVEAISVDEHRAFIYDPNTEQYAFVQTGELEPAPYRPMQPLFDIDEQPEESILDSFPWFMALTVIVMAICLGVIWWAAEGGFSWI